MDDELSPLALRARAHALQDLRSTLDRLDNGDFVNRAEGVRRAGELAELVARLEYACVRRRWVTGIDIAGASASESALSDPGDLT